MTSIRGLFCCFYGVSFALVMACTPDKVPGDTDSKVGDTSTTMTAGEPTEGATETGGVPAECEEKDPAVSAAWSLELPGWKSDSYYYEFDRVCGVVSVTIEAGVVTTALECEVDGATEAATLEIAAAPEGEVAWEAGQSVRLRADSSDDFEFYEAVRLYAADDDALLLVAVSGGAEQGFKKMFAPLMHTIVEACGISDYGGAPILPAQLEIGSPEGESVAIFSGHRGVLAIDAASSFVIDAARVEIGFCCHYGEEEEVLLRRVITGG